MYIEKKLTMIKNSERHKNYISCSNNKILFKKKIEEKKSFIFFNMSNYFHKVLSQYYWNLNR